MNPAIRNYGLSFGLIVALLAVWDYSRPIHSTRPAPPQVENGLRPPPHDPRERYDGGRNHLQESTLRSIDKPHAIFCSEEGHYPPRWAELGKPYITREWSHTNGQLVERVTKELHNKGYSDLMGLELRVSRRVAAMLYGLPFTGQPCKD